MMLLLILFILEWEGITSKIAQIIPGVRLRGNKLPGPGEIFVGVKIWSLTEKLPGGRRASSPFSQGSA